MGTSHEPPVEDPRANSTRLSDRVDEEEGTARSPRHMQPAAREDIRNRHCTMDDKERTSHQPLSRAAGARTFDVSHHSGPWPLAVEWSGDLSDMQPRRIQ